MCVLQRKLIRTGHFVKKQNIRIRTKWSIPIWFGHRKHEVIDQRHCLETGKDSNLTLNENCSTKNGTS